MAVALRSAVARTVARPGCALGQRLPPDLPAQRPKKKKKKSLGSGLSSLFFCFAAITASCDLCMCCIIDKGLWMSGTFRRAMGALGADTAAHLHGGAAGCLLAAAADRLFMATEPDARCCHAVVVAGTGASRSQPLAAWRDRCTGPSEIPQKAGKKGTNGDLGDGLPGPVWPGNLCASATQDRSWLRNGLGAPPTSTPAPWRLVCTGRLARHGCFCPN